MSISKLVLLIWYSFNQKIKQIQLIFTLKIRIFLFLIRVVSHFYQCSGLSCTYVEPKIQTLNRLYFRCTISTRMVIMVDKFSTNNFKNNQQGTSIKGCPIFCNFFRYLPTLVLFCTIFRYIPKIGHPTLPFGKHT